MNTGKKVFWVFAGIAFSALFFFGAVASFAALYRRAGLGRIAIVNIRGAVYDSRETIELIRGYGKDDRVKGLVLRIDSPGGAVAPVQEIYMELARIREQKGIPIVASLGGVAASGGYYIACGADRIFASPGTVTGSIGVLISTVNMEELFGRIGIDFTTIKSGPYKDTGTYAREMTLDEKEYLQELVDGMHRQFIEAVGERRGLEYERLAEISDGRIFSGRTALELNLVDEIGTLYDAIESAAEIAGIDRWEVVEERRRRSLWQIVFGLVSDGYGEMLTPLYIHGAFE